MMSVISVNSVTKTFKKTYIPSALAVPKKLKNTQYLYNKKMFY